MRADGATETGRGIPSRPRGVHAERPAVVVVRLRDIAADAGRGVENRLNESEHWMPGRSARLIEQRHKTGIQRRYGAGAADDVGRSVDHDVVARDRIGIAADVWRAAANIAGRRLRHAGDRGLVARLRERVAHTAATRAPTGRTVIPDGLVGAGCWIRRHEPRTAAGHAV